MKIIWAPLAVEQLEEIADYIAYDKPLSAENWVNTIFETVENLSEFPESGRMVPELNRNDIREIIKGNYRIIYKVLNDEIHILTIRHGKRLFDEKVIEA